MNRVAVYAAAGIGAAFIVGAASGAGTTASLRGPDPTPQVITTTRVVELPTPTPVTVTKTVEVSVTPASCLDAIEAGDDLVVALLDLADAFLNEEWDKSERLMDAIEGDMGSWDRYSKGCRRGTGAGA